MDDDGLVALATRARNVSVRLGVRSENRDDAIQESLKRLIAKEQRDGRIANDHRLAYFLRIFRNVGIEMSVRNARARELTQDLAEAFSPNANEDPAVHLERQQELGRVRKLLSRMPPLRRAIVIARALGESAEDVASELRLSVDLVNKVRSRFRAELRQGRP